IFTGEISIDQEVIALPALPFNANPVALQIDENGRHLIIATDQAQLLLYDITHSNAVKVQPPVVIDKGAITAMEFLIGTGSLIIGTEQGALQQWFLVRNHNNVYQ